jgi:NDP-sugar pyrophosphorylase family protein
MRAVILAGGEGTRLRPLTLTLPKPVVPVLDRPFLAHQLDLLASVGVREVVFSVAYRPEKIRACFGDGSAQGRRLHYAFEESPLGTGGAVKNAEALLDDVTIVFNGDVLTDVDLPAVVERHRATRSAATIVLAPVPNPAAYGLVETAPDGRVRRFVEKPDPAQITTDTINAGIYVLDTRTLALMPTGVKYSIERAFFPTLLERGEPVGSYTHRGYWIDIGTPEKYLQVHRDILEGRFPVELAAERRAGGWVHAEARVAGDALLEGPFYIGPGCSIAAGSVVGPGSVLVGGVALASGARVRDSVIWSGTALGAGASVEGALLGSDVTVGPHCRIGAGAVLGEGCILSDHSRIP